MRTNIEQMNTEKETSVLNSPEEIDTETSEENNDPFIAENKDKI